MPLPGFLSRPDTLHTTPQLVLLPLPPLGLLAALLLLALLFLLLLPLPRFLRLRPLLEALVVRVEEVLVDVWLLPVRPCLRLVVCLRSRMGREASKTRRKGLSRGGRHEASWPF